MTTILLYHLCSAADWATTVRMGHYLPPAARLEGFIHLSTVEQVEESARQFFRNVTDLLLLTVDAAQLGASLKWENAFPHLYGPLPVMAVLAVEGVSLDAAGYPNLPFLRSGGQHR